MWINHFHWTKRESESITILWLMHRNKNFWFSTIPLSSLLILWFANRSMARNHSQTANLHWMEQKREPTTTSEVPKRKEREHRHLLHFSWNPRSEWLRSSIKFLVPGFQSMTHESSSCVNVERYFLGGTKIEDFARKEEEKQKIKKVLSLKTELARKSFVNFISKLSSYIFINLLNSFWISFIFEGVQIILFTPDFWK